MIIKELLKNRPTAKVDNKKLIQTYNRFEKLINELRNRRLPIDIIEKINIEIESVNKNSDSEVMFLKHLTIGKRRIFKLIEKKLKLVPKNHYRNLWMVLGMSSFGIPLGLVYGLAIDNIGLFGTGLPIGMVNWYRVGDPNG